MAAIINGLALHGGFIPFGGTFLMFSDYARNARAHGGADEGARDSCYTHDSIGLGEDGPTHQPVEHLATLRLIPNEHGLASVRYGRKRGRLEGCGRAPRGPDRA